MLGEAHLALTAFPVDPDLPTLSRAMDPDALRGLAYSGRGDLQPAVEVAHRPREGACVLRYRFARQDGRPTGRARRVLYGKVYADDSGQRVDGYLRSLERDGLARHSLRAARFPTSVAYLPDTRLLVTAELAGEAVVPHLLKRDPGVERRRCGRRCRAAGRGAERRVVPWQPCTPRTWRRRRSIAPPTRWRRCGATLPPWRRSGPTWPPGSSEPSTRRRRDVPNVRRLVLSHGDFTPSQVLGLDGHAPAVLDLDTLRWADPAAGPRALPRSRRAAGRQGRGSRPPGDTLERLAEELVGGYVEAAARPTAVPAPDRIAYYMSTTLARSALNSCRQLKTQRLELALSLLENIYARG